MVVGLLGDGIDEFFTVRDHAAVVGQTVLARVVGHGVVRGGVLGPGHGHHEEHQGRHGDDDVLDSEEEMEKETQSVILIPFIFV